MDLLQMLAAETIDTSVVHSVLPAFNVACGIDFLALCDAGQEAGLRAWALGSGGTTCPACLQAFGGLDGLKREISRQQGHQAPIES